MPKLVITEGAGRGTAYDIADGMTIGRSSQNTIQLFDEQVSRQHARVQVRNGKCIIEDLGSRNGVIVNGERVERAELEPGDSVRIGDTVLVFEPPAEETDGDQETTLTSVIRQTVKADGFGDTDTGELSTAHRYLKTIYDMNRTLAATMDIEELLDKLLAIALDALEQEDGVILLCDPRGSLVPAASRTEDGSEAQISLSSTITRHVINKREAVTVTDARKDPRFSDAKSVSLHGMRSVMCAPLISRGKVLGVIQVESRKNIRGFSAEDLHLLVAIAGQAAGAIEAARAYGELKKENVALRRRAGTADDIIGSNPAFLDALRTAAKVARTSSTVLLTGETGTGKELVAMLLHESSPRRSKPFVCFNCAAVSESLVESELFGHEKGAFTGAVKTKLGLFEVADGGTIFLDEIGDVSPGIQVKLLRVVENKTFNRVGGIKPIEVDVRIIAATSRDLKKKVEDGTFREDLYYRLSVVPIHLPPLRERKDDIPELAQYFLSKFSSTLGCRATSISDEAMEILAAYSWPGNVRELQNVIERAVVLCEGDEITPEHLPIDVVSPDVKHEMESLLASSDPLAEKLRKLEELCIRRALAEAKGKKVLAAKILNISRPTLDKRIREFGLDDE